MPYPSEHAARLTNPDKYESFARKNDFLGKGIDAVFGIIKGKSEMQAIRFDASKYTPQQVLNWLKMHKIVPIKFEPAKK